MTSKQPGGLSVIEQLAAYVVTESFEKLPEATVRAARRAILDTLGVTLAGSVEPTAARVRALIAHRRAPDEATIIGTPLRASVEDAALANGTASHALDYDDLNQSLSGHPSVPVLSAALALGERQRASGAARLAAFVAGVEIEAKLGRALNPAHYEIGWHATAAPGGGARDRPEGGRGRRVRRQLHGAAPAHLRPGGDGSAGQVLDALLHRRRAAGPHGGTRTVRRGARAPRRRADPHAEGADVRPPGAGNPPEPPHAVHRGRDQARRRPAIGAPRAPGEGAAAESADRRGAHHQVLRLRGPRAATRAGGVRSGDGAGA